MESQPKTININKLVELMLDFHRTYYPQIVEKFRTARKLREIFGSVTAIKDRVVFTEAEVTEVAQAYQPDWTPKGGLSLTPEEYQVRYMKVDRDINPNDLRQTYLADMLPNAQSEEHEIVRLYYKKMLERSALDTDRALIKGKYVAPTKGQAGKSTEMVDGLIALVQSFVTKKQITPVKVGAINATNAVTQIKKLYKAIPEDFRENPLLKCYMFSGMWDAYFENHEATRGVMTDYAQQKKRVIPGTDCEIVILPHGGASDMVLFTMENNVKLIENEPSDLLKFTIEKAKRMLNYMQDWAAGICFVVVGEAGNAENQYVWCNDFTGLTIPE